MRFLVTGVGGFIGSRLAVDLAQTGHDVVGTWHNSPSSNPALANLALHQIDLRDGEALFGLMRNTGPFDAVVHAAAVINPIENSAYLVQSSQVNVLAHANLIAAALEHNCRRFIFTSTIGVYGYCGSPTGGYREEDAAPTTYYGWSKRAAEQLLDVASLKGDMIGISLRLAGVHGIGRTSGALHAMTRTALDANPIAISAPKSRFRWSFIEDVSSAIQIALEAPLDTKHHVINLASADIFSLEDLAWRIKKFTGSKSKIDVQSNTSSRDETMNIELATSTLNFRPTPLDVFLTRYLEDLSPK